MIIYILMVMIEIIIMMIDVNDHGDEKNDKDNVWPGMALILHMGISGW